MTSRSGGADLLETLDLTEYEATALSELLALGRVTAPTLAESAGIPKARIYGVLDSLAEAGYVKLFPGRPKEYQPKPPGEILDRAIENRRQRYEGYRSEVESIRGEFMEEFGPIYEGASEEITPAEELFYVVDVGEPSERETRTLYHDADDEIGVMTKAFEYFGSVEPALEDALDRGVSISVLFLHPDHLSEENRRVQAGILERLREDHPAVDVRYSNEPMPWRGTFADPSMDYETGKAILLVEEKDIPLSMRQAAITENGSFVAGLKRYFDLIREHDGSPVPAVDAADGERE